MKPTIHRTAAGALYLATSLLATLTAPTTIRAAAVLGGGVLLSVGAGRIYEPAGLIVGGVLLLGAGLAGHMRGGAK